MFTIGVATTLTSHSEAVELIRSESADMDDRLQSLDDRTMEGVCLAAVGAGVTVFALLIDEGRRMKERLSKRGFFH